MSSDPINPAVPPYYMIGGTELREGHRLHYGADRLADHLVMSADEYIKRAGAKPGVPRVDDLRKAAWCLTQAINALEGRHVSDDGASPTPEPPAGLRDAAVAMLAAMVGPHGPSVMRGRQIPAGNAPNHGHSVPGVWDASNGPDLGGKPCEWCAAWDRFVAAVESETEPTSDPPPATVVPELPAGETPKVPGLYWMQHGSEDAFVFRIDQNNIEHHQNMGAGWRFAGPIPLPSFAREGRDGGQNT